MSENAKKVNEILNMLEDKLMHIEEQYCERDHQMPTKIEMKWKELRVLVFERLKKEKNGN